MSISPLDTHVFCSYWLSENNARNGYRKWADIQSPQHSLTQNE